MLNLSNSYSCLSTTEGDEGEEEKGSEGEAGDDEEEADGEDL